MFADTLQSNLCMLDIHVIVNSLGIEPMILVLSAPCPTNLATGTLNLIRSLFHVYFKLVHYALIFITSCLEEFPHYSRMAKINRKV